MINKFSEIEKKYPVEKVFYKDEQIWGMLRIRYYWAIVNKTFSDSKINKDNKKIFSKIKRFKRLKNIFYGFFNWFRKYDYLIFSDTQERKLINGKYYDKSFDKLIELKKDSKFLVIENPNPEHHRQSKVFSPYIVSLDLLNFLFKILNVFYKKEKIRLELFDTINKNEELNADYSNYINKFFAKKSFYKLIFKIYKPKAIFFSCYYCYPEAVAAANELSIKTIEMQHGIIGKEHFAYNPKKKIDSKFFPQVLLTFGDYDKFVLEKNKNNPFNKIYPVGSFYLEYIKNKEIPAQLLEIVERYKYSFSVSTQYTVEDKLVEFIINLAKKRKDICFLFSLRHHNKEYYKKFKLPDNIYLFKDEFNCYDILRSCNYHISVYSTCALESIFFKKVTFLINIENLSYKYFNQFSSENIYYINNEKDFFELLGKSFRKESLPIFKENYEKNLLNLIKRKVI